MAWPLLAAIGGAAATIGGDIISGEYQKAISREQMEWQEKENQRNRDWQSSEWTRQFNLANEYNDPAKQKQRLIAAGINPSAMEGSSGITGSSQASPSASSGASTSPSFPAMNAYQNLGADMSNAFSNILNSLTNREISGPQRSMLENLAQKYGNEAINEAVKTEMNAFERDMQTIYGESLKNAKVQSAVAEYYNILADTKLKGTQADLNDAQKLESMSNALLSDSKRYLNSRQYELLGKTLKYYDSQVQSEIRRNNAAASESSANARLSSARSYAQEFENKIKDENRDAVEKRIRSEAQNSANVSHLTDAQRKLVHWLSEKAHQESDLYKVKAYAELVHMLVGDVINSVSEFTKVGALNKLGDAKLREVEAKEREFNSTQ